MDPNVKALQTGEGEERWLSMLIGAMEQASRAECRAEPCDPPILAQLRLQLARPASPSSHSTTAANPGK
jgi:hypothetical protein